MRKNIDILLFCHAEIFYPCLEQIMDVLRLTLWYYRNMYVVNGFELSSVVKPCVLLFVCFCLVRSHKSI